MSYTVAAYNAKHELLDLDVNDCARYGGLLTGLSYGEAIEVAAGATAAMVDDYETMAHHWQPVAYYLVFLGRECVLIVDRSNGIATEEIVAQHTQWISECPPVHHAVSGTATEPGA